MLTKLEIIRHQDFDAVWMQVRYQILPQADSQVKYLTQRHVGELVDEPVYDLVAAQVEFQLLDHIEESV